MAKARATLIPWVRRQLAREPLVVRMRFFHVPDSSGRGNGAHVDDLLIPSPRPESMSPESITDELIDLCRAHAETFGGRQCYRVNSYDVQGDEPLASWPFAVVVDSAEVAQDTSSEPHDGRTFGMMASRHSEQLHRSMMSSVQAMVSTFGDLVDRLDKRLVSAETRADRYQELAMSGMESRIMVFEEALQLRREAEAREEDGEMQQAAFLLLQQALPVLGPVVSQGIERFFAPKKKRKRSKPKKKTRARKKALEVVS